MNKPQIQLIARDGTLYCPSALQDEWVAPDGYSMCLRVYDAGDCDRVSWGTKESCIDNGTRKWNENLATCIFDFVEMGVIPYRHDEFIVILPDNTTFNYLNFVQ